MRDLVGRSPHGDTAFAADSATASLRGRGLRVRGPRLHRRAGGLRLAGSAAFRCSDRAVRRGTSNDRIRFDACTDVRPRRGLGNDGACDPDRFRCWGRELPGRGHRHTRGLERVASSAAAKGRRTVRRLRCRGPRGRGVPRTWFRSRAVHRRRRTPWPATLLFLSPALFGLPIFAGLGIALALGAYAFRQALPLSRPAVALAAAAAAAAGALAIGVVVALAFASPNSSARFELVPAGLAGTFAAAFASVLGLLAMRRSPLLAGLGIAAGTTILTLASLSPASVSCEQHGYSTSSGPWWLGPPGSMSTSGGGGGSSGTFGGAIVRGDGTTIRFTCNGSTLSEFVIEQH